VFVSHDAGAVERLCERAILLRGGRTEFDGPTHQAIVSYHRMLAAETDPEERAAGLREWGSGEARIDDVVLVGADGEARKQYLAGEPFAVRIRVSAERPLAAPRLTYELRGEGGLLLAAGVQDTAELGWDEAGALPVRFEVDRLPLADGRFRLRLGLVDPGTGRLYHQLDEAASFLVYPEGDERGPLRFEGRWTRGEIAAAAELPRS
jgi:lipopolysaccharide transport system ATP-binding protein